ncbi:MAG: hypothetical protein ACTJHU_08055 [Mycetocola sp.]
MTPTTELTQPPSRGTHSWRLRTVLVGIVAAMALVFAGLTPAQAAGRTINVTTTKLVQPQAANDYVTFSFALTGITGGETVDFELRRGNTVRYSQTSAQLASGATKTNVRVYVPKADFPVGGAVRVDAFVRSGYTKIASKSVNLTTVAPQKITTASQKFTASKSSTSCKDVFWKVKVSGVNASYWSLRSQLTKKGKSPITGSLVGGTPKNGTNTFRGFVCASSSPAGKWATESRVVIDGATLAKSSVQSTLVVTPKVQVYSVSGSAKKSSKRTVTGYVSPTVDVVGKTVKVYAKNSGAKKYTLAGKAKIDKNGRFVVKSSKVWVGKIYATMDKTTYTKKAKSSTVTVKKIK